MQATNSGSQAATVAGPHTGTPGGPGARAGALVVAALGVVFGDIGTSPLYAVRECFFSEHACPPTPPNILGVISLVVWTLLMVVCLKYLAIVLRADNRGEGGVLALMALVVHPEGHASKRLRAAVIVLGILGASLLYIDGVLTPAISVLSAVEGLTQINPILKHAVVPLALAILVTLFLVQSHGTARVGLAFGPVLVLWFLALAMLGATAIAQDARILAAFNPVHAAEFIATQGLHGLWVLGSVFLCVTGAEVLYADMGHFGRRPIRRAWYWIVLPALVLNYMGQGAYLLAHDGRADNLFYDLAPSWFLLPLIVLATAATVIASQAVISGAFSLARQSVQMGFWPRLHVRHTSTDVIGQVYVPAVNWALLAGAILLVLGFRSSSQLAAAYGIAVSTTMLITAGLVIQLARTRWSARRRVWIPLAAIFLLVDGVFFCANATKLVSGGWIVIALGVTLCLMMTTWVDGRRVLRAWFESQSIDVATFVRSLEAQPPARVPGVAVFLSGSPDGVPGGLLHNLKHNKVLHETTVLLCVRTSDVPVVPDDQRVKVDSYGLGLHRIVLTYGFSESPNIPRALLALDLPGVRFSTMGTTYFLGRESLVPARKRTMASWRKRLFMFMARNAEGATGFFHLPPNRVVELGAQVQL